MQNRIGTAVYGSSVQKMWKSVLLAPGDQKRPVKGFVQDTVALSWLTVQSY